jgi:hypothetical protein
MSIKEGIRTSEFWLTVLTVVAATVLVLTDNLSEELWAAAVGIQGAGYSVSRGLTKGKNEPKG